MITMIKNAADRVPGTLLAVTHGSLFHADEVFATAILGKAHGGLSVLRVNRVPEDLPPDAVVYDIGNGARENGIPYAACGLVWREFGMSLAGSQAAWEKVDRGLIQGIDAVDNGLGKSAGTTISHIVSEINPCWDEDAPSDEAFVRAVAFAEPILEREIACAVSAQAATDVVSAAVEASADGVMVLPRFVPWKDALSSHPSPKAQDVLYVVFPSNRGGWNVQAVPDIPNGFGMRKPLPEAWRGLCDAALQAESGVPGATFCHAAGFLASANNRVGGADSPVLPHHRAYRPVHGGSTA